MVRDRCILRRRDELVPVAGPLPAAHALQPGDRPRGFGPCPGRRPGGKRSPGDLETVRPQLPSLSRHAVQAVARSCIRHGVRTRCPSLRGDGGSLLRRDQRGARDRCVSPARLVSALRYRGPRDDGGRSRPADASRGISECLGRPRHPDLPARRCDRCGPAGLCRQSCRCSAVSRTRTPRRGPVI